MLNIFKSWYKKYFSHPEAVLLLLFLMVSFGLIFTMGEILAPVMTSLVIVYLLQWWVNFLVNHNIPRNIAYPLVYIVFLAIFITAILVLLPLLWRQFSNLFTDLPYMLQNAKSSLIKLAEQYPAYFSKQQIDTLFFSMLSDVHVWAKTKVSSSFSYIPGIIAWLVYLFLVPLLVFFFLKDSQIIINWFARFFPKNKKVLKTIWLEMDKQIGNYVRGKILQITIASIINGMVFLFFDLNYAILIAAIVGISEIVPYIGAVVVSIPLILVGYLQWGFSLKLGYLLGVYFIIQALDGNVLVPILFSKAVNLHPIAIVIAILFFGSLWGFWGVVFAIPLATLVKTVLMVWPIASGHTR
jgi:putative permease